MASTNPVIRYEQAKNGTWGFKLQGGNNEIQVSGHGYDTEASVLQGVIDAKVNMARATVKKITARGAKKRTAKK